MLFSSENYKSCNPSIKKDVALKYPLAQIEKLGYKVRWFRHVKKGDSGYAGQKMMKMELAAEVKKEEHGKDSWIQRICVTDSDRVR